MRSHFVLQEIWIGLRRNLTMTMALIVVVAISLSLLGTGLLFVKQVDRTRTYWQGKVELSIYLCIKTSPQPQCQRNGPATDAERAQLQQRLKSMPQVEAVYYVNQHQAYQEFRQYFSNQPAMVQDTQEGDIPDSFQVKLKNPEADYNIVASAVNGTTGVERMYGAPPAALTLEPVQPNPMRERVRIGFGLPVGARVRLQVIDLLGREVALLEDEALPAGTFAFDWDGRGAGRTVPTGMYFVRLEVDGRRLVRRLVVAH